MDESSYSWLSRKSISLSKLIAHKGKESADSFDQAYGGVPEAIVEIMDNTYSLLCQHVWMFNTPDVVNLPKNDPAIASAIYKIFFVLHSALNLTREGLYGPARTLLRHTFEFLIVGKFCGISHDDRIFNRWDSGDTVYFTNGILNKIQNPDNSEFKAFWELMCQYSHATNSSQQIDIDWNKNESDTYITLTFIRAIVECQYHLLNSIYITKSMRAMALSLDDNNEIKPLRVRNRELINKSRSFMSKKLRLLV